MPFNYGNEAIIVFDEAKKITEADNITPTDWTTLNLSQYIPDKTDLVFLSADLEIKVTNTASQIYYVKTTGLSTDQGHLLVSSKCEGQDDMNIDVVGYNGVSCSVDLTNSQFFARSQGFLIVQLSENYCIDIKTVSSISSPVVNLFNLYINGYI